MVLSRLSRSSGRSSPVDVDPGRRPSRPSIGGFSRQPIDARFAPPPGSMPLSRSVPAVSKVDLNLPKRSGANVGTSNCTRQAEDAPCRSRKRRERDGKERYMATREETRSLRRNLGETRCHADDGAAAYAQPSLSSSSFVSRWKRPSPVDIKANYGSRKTV